MEESNRKSIIISLTAIVIVLLVAFLSFGCGTSSPAYSPEIVVDKYFQALENKDAEAMEELLSSDSEKYLKEEVGANDGSSLTFLIEEYVFTSYTFTFYGLEYDSVINGNEATVNVIDGDVAMEDILGEREERSVKDLGTIKVVLVAEDGEWRIDLKGTMGGT